MIRTNDSRSAGPDQSTDSRLVSAVREYQAALDAGRPPNRSAFLARHPEVAGDLADCLDGLLLLHDALPRPDDGVAAGVPLGDFRIVRELGRGGMGVVYEALQLSLGRRVALKVLPFAATLDARQLQRFRMEAAAAANLHHPHIVQVYGVGCDRGVHYYAMQFIEGQTLADVIRLLRESNPQPSPDLEREGKGMKRASSPLSRNVEKRETEAAARTTHRSATGREHFRTVARWGVEAAEALDHAHQFGVVHRDIKPANLLLDTHGTLYVTDFGLAHVGDGDPLTRTGDVVGTLRYMSPEQARGERAIDPRGDVYALGATLYELLTLHAAFPATDRQRLLRQVLDDDPTPARRVNRAVPAELAVIVHKALAKNPADRYANSRALADDLRAWLDDRPIRGRPPGLTQRLAKWARRHRAAVAVGVLGLVLAVAGLLASTLLIATERSRLRVALSETDAARSELAGALARETRTAYGYRLPLARRALEDGDVARAAQLLAAGPPAQRGWEWHYLNRRLDTATFTLRPPFGPTGAMMTAVRFNPDGQTVLSWTPTSSVGPPLIQSWDARTGTPSGLFLAPSDAGPNLELSPDGSRCAIFTHATAHKASTRPDVRVFQRDTGAEVCRLIGPAAGVTEVAFSHDGRRLATAGADGAVILWDINIGESLTTLRGSDEPVVGLAFSPDGARLATFASRAAFEGALTSGKLPGQEEPIADLRLWDTHTGAALAQWAHSLCQPFHDRGRWVRFSPDGRHLAVATGLTTGPRLLTVPDGRELVLPKGAILRSFSPDGRTGFLFQPDGSAGAIDLASGQPTAHFSLSEPAGQFGAADLLNLPRRAVAVGADGRRVAFAHGDGRVSVWDTVTGREVITLRGPAQIQSLDFSPDGRQVAAVALDQTLQVWDLSAAGDSRVLAAAPEHAAFAALAISPDGRTAAALCDPSIGQSGTAPPTELVLWDLPTGRERLRRAVPGLQAVWAALGIGGLEFSPDGQRLAATGMTVDDSDAKNPIRRAVSVWDVARGVEVLARQYEGPNELPVVCLAPPTVLGTRFPASGRPFVYIVSRTLPPKDGAPPQYTLSARDAEQGAEFWSLTATSRLGPLAVNRDGRLAAVSAVRGSGPVSALRVWDISTGRLLWELPADPAGSLLELAFSPDGRRLLSVPLPDDAKESAEEWRGEAVVWDVATGRSVCAFRPPVAKLPFGQRRRSRFVFSADGRRLASFGGVAGVRIWDATHGQELLTLGGPDIVAEATFSTDGWLVTLGQDGAIRTWDGRTTPGLTRPPTASAELDRQARELVLANEPAHGDAGPAVALATEAVRAYPNRPSFRVTLGLAQYRAGDATAAAATLEQGLALGAGDHEGVCCFALALVQGQLGHSEAARRWFDRGERWLRDSSAATEDCRDQARRLRVEAVVRLGSSS